MSDVNISTSWSSLPSSDTEYNTVLGVAGYNPDDERLFLSAQQVPGIARNVTTEYARGFRITSGYDGIVLHDAITETSADLKTIKFTMSVAGTAYDLTDARLYAQFKNPYSVAISSWALQAQAADDTLTTIASGGTIAAGAELQIDFKNDYSAVRFILTCTYSAQMPYDTGSWITIPAGTPVNTYYTTYNGLSKYIESWTLNPMYMGSFMGGQGYYEIIFVSQASVPAERNPWIKGDGTNLQVRNWQSISRDGTTIYYALVSNTANIAPNTDPYEGGTTYHENIQMALDAWLSPQNGIDTASLSEYTGIMWQCRLIANVAAISPGPMATESEGGTQGNFDITSDQISAPSIPSTYTQSYFGHIYLIDSGNLSAVASVINSTDFIDQIYTNFGDIAKCIVSISQFPIATYSGAGTLGDITVGSKRIASAALTPQARPLSRFAQVDCGSVDLHLFWDSALDLNPYTKLSVYIPCVGMRPLDADVVMGHTLGLYYNVDFMTGNALAILTLDGDYYDQYSCTLATQYALNTEQWGPVYQGIMSTLSTAAIGVAVSGSGGAMAGALAGAATQSVAQKLHHDKAGTMGASMSLFSQMQPFVEILRPIQQLPRDYTKFNAYPSYMTSQLINLSGYVEVQDIRLDDIDCTDAERTELMNMLQSGIIL